MDKLEKIKTHVTHVPTSPKDPRKTSGYQQSEAIFYVAPVGCFAFGSFWPSGDG